MSDNVGLSTPRGSGTSGYVQRSLAHLKPRDRAAPYPPRDQQDALRHRQRQPDRGILEHERKRRVEVEVFELQDRLEDEGVSEEEIEERCDELRQKLLARQKDNECIGPRRLKMHQTHELAEAKIRESERMRSALKISKDYEEGGHWKRQEDWATKKAEAERRDEDGDGNGNGNGNGNGSGSGSESGSDDGKRRD